MPSTVPTINRSQGSGCERSLPHHWTATPLNSSFLHGHRFIPVQTEANLEQRLSQRVSLRAIGRRWLSQSCKKAILSHFEDSEVVSTTKFD